MEKINMLIDKNTEPVYSYTCSTCKKPAVGIINDKWCIKCFIEKQDKQMDNND